MLCVLTSGGLEEGDDGEDEDLEGQGRTEAELESEESTDSKAPDTGAVPYEEDEEDEEEEVGEGMDEEGVWMGVDEGCKVVELVSLVASKAADGVEDVISSDFVALKEAVVLLNGVPVLKATG